ncbi:MFS transporter [Flavobacteriaceae bacterium]|nr:MFS transporter [Flavobacteriaceae bacterium]MDA8948694.1 MFS transporter [Flavobacteriaceae bacterium]MDA9015998.1 MFS transporter [Flavobacteriaceae bacterium]
MILSGELVFILPYFLSRVFRPTFLEVFNLTNIELGSLFSVYGTVALFSYLYGGTLADRFLPGKLISISLLSTALGGLLLATYPSLFILQLLYGYWGFTTVFLFWGAMIKGTRMWGGTKNQGQAFGFLDGGRGVVAALMGSIGVYIYSLFLEVDVQNASILERQEAFRYVILFVSFIIGIIGIVIYFKLNIKPDEQQQQNPSHSFKNIRTVLKLESVWLLMFIILCAYFGYKVTDIYSLYASEVMNYNEIEAANVGSLQLYLRPLACVLFGLLADRSRSTFWIIIGFLVMLIGSIIFASGFVQSGLNGIFFMSLVVLAVGTYAIRALYFAVLEEGNISLTLTGTAVGIISLTGYTPDIFAGPLMGYYLDEYPGLLGHQYIFIYLAGFSVLGLICTFRFAKISK